MENHDQNPRPTQSTTQRVYLRLRQSIISGELPPGDRLKVDTLKTMLDSGASPVREALSLLTSDQLVERLDQRGFRVAPAGRMQFDEILKLRCTLEDLALRESVLSGDKEWEEKVVLAHHHLSRSDRRETEEFEALHKQFHLTLLSACKSPILLNFCAQLYDLNVRYRHLAGKSKRYGKRDVDAEHFAILNAAVDHDADTESALLMAHYQKTGLFLSEQID